VHRACTAKVLASFLFLLPGPRAYSLLSTTLKSTLECCSRTPLHFIRHLSFHHITSSERTYRRLSFPRTSRLFFVPPTIPPFLQVSPALPRPIIPLLRQPLWGGESLDLPLSATCVSSVVSGIRSDCRRPISSEHSSGYSCLLLGPAIRSSPQPAQKDAPELLRYRLPPTHAARLVRRCISSTT